MKTSYKIAVVALPLAVVTFLLSRVIWPDPVGMMGPEPALLPFFIFLGALESLAFGIGIGFLVFGWPKMRGALEDRTLSLLAFFSIAWLLVSWWPHDNMHRVNGMDNFAGLLKIEFIFHFTLIIAAFILATFFWKLISHAGGKQELK